MEKRYRTDFRIIIFFQYIFIGGGDVIFWWTVWNIADYANPISPDIHNIYMTFIHGYVFVVVANVCYLTTRRCFKRTLDKYSDESQQELHPTSIVTITSSKQIKRTSKYLLVSCLFPVCVYFLALGFIHIWRGLFALFYYVVEEYLFSKGVNMILSRVVLMLFVGITLMFNQKNNTVNLCPTHKIFKFDELEYLETMFKMHILNIPKTSNDVECVNADRMDIVEEGIITNLNTSAEVLPFEKMNCSRDTTGDSSIKRKPLTPFDHNFSSALYLTEFLKKFHRRKRIPFCAKRVLPIPVKCQCSPSDHIRINIDVLKMISKSCGINFIENVGLLSDEPRDVATDLSENNTRDTCLCMYVEIYKSKEKNNEYEVNVDDVNDISSDRVVNNTDIKLVDFPTSGDQTNCTCGSVIVKKFVQKVTPQELKDRNIRIFNNSDNSNKTNNNNNHDHTIRTDSTDLRTSNTKSDVTVTSHNNHSSCEENCIHCRLIHICAYIYSIHYEHVFLNTFGGMFWSSVWALFDTITKPMFTQSAQDVPWFLLVAIASLCLNHLVLFPIKEGTKTLRWRTLCEFLCGINTVLFWASMWHVLDIFILLFSNKLLVFILLHVAVFLLFSVFKVSINVAL